MINWYSIKDKLPEGDEVPVLVWRDLSISRKGATAKVYGVETFRKETACLNDRFGISDIRITDVTHWAYINPPEEK